MRDTNRHMVARCPDCHRITAAYAHFDKDDQDCRTEAARCAKRGDVIEYHDGPEAVDMIRAAEWGCKCKELQRAKSAAASPALPGMEALV